MKDTLALDRKEDADTRRKKSDQEEANNKVVEPLTKASDEVKKLEIQKVKHDKIMAQLNECQV